MILLVDSAVRLPKQFSSVRYFAASISSLQYQIDVISLAMYVRSSFSGPRKCVCVCVWPPGRTAAACQPASDLYGTGSFRSVFFRDWI